MPLPINVIADVRSTALGSVMSDPLAEPTWTNRMGAIRSGLGAGNQQAFGAPSPQIVDHDIDAFGELRLEGAFQLPSARPEVSSHRPQAPRQISGRRHCGRWR